MNNIKNSRPIVLGLGNPLFQDEGLGIHVISQLMDGDLGARADLVDGGTDGLALLGVVEDARYLIVVDAIDGGYLPGTVKKLQGQEVNLFARNKLSVHQLGFQEVLALAQMRDRYPQHLVLIGVQPQSLDWGTMMTPAVSRAVPRVIQMVLDQVNNWVA